MAPVSRPIQKVFTPRSQKEGAGFIIRWSAMQTRTSQALRTVRTSYAYRLLRTARTEGAGQLGSRRHALYVRRTCTSLGRAVRTAYRVVHRRRSIGSSYSTRCS